MRVKFLKDWTFAGSLEGIFVMIDYKAGQELRLKAAVYARAKSKGVIEDVPNRRPAKAAAEADETLGGDAAGDEQGADTGGRGDHGDAEASGAGSGT